MVFSVLLEHTKDLDHRDNNGDTVLDLCVKDGFTQGVKLLLQTNRVSVSDTVLELALSQSARTQDEEIIRMLKEALEIKNGDSSQSVVTGETLGAQALEVK